MIRSTLSPEFHQETRELLRICNAGVHAAQAENRRLGVPNVYSINGIIYYELPNGELSRQDPYTGDKPAEK